MNKLFKILLWMVILLGGLTIPLFIGEGPFSFKEMFSSPQTINSQIILSVRLPRIFFAFLVGASLSLVGAVFQVLLRNELATPYTLGISSGGALGAVLAIKAGLVIQLFAFSSTVIFSIAGSLLTVGLIYFIARERQEISTLTLLLAGVTIGLFFSSLILFIHYLADFTETYRMIRWLMGALDVVGWKYPLTVFTILAPVFVYLYYHAIDFNLLLSGNEMAKARGVNVRSLQKWSFIVSSFLVGACVSMAGPIGFVGLIVPHIMRLLVGADHRVLLPHALVGGGLFLVWCDTIARSIIAPAELPVGVVTSLLGAPFFIYLLIKYKVG
ncbi:ABC-type transporter, integral membrane subunit [Caldithrix abyssi DSM 13497]|uniref:ABC-type transporter, integral membrane subunit n=1 Tax=Caldithrix abyssi DSM 13497 TaxID=880073 RepID=H1XXA3_CALAY|nr:iron ABC transporter permease [Caldithrix abyssi]APF17820.1 iron complex transport system permease protein [Caldithrix abyssi DSM 13497]EHO41888.1 ABC-type transporter, integral membrane subunit [Caldithrix abyssi DSM 13497]